MNLRNVNTSVVHARLSDADRVALCRVPCRGGLWDTERAVTCKRCKAKAASSGAVAEPGER